MPAEFDVNAPRGQETVNHTSSNGVVELAIRSAAFLGHPEIYGKKDIEKEKELAAIDFYNGKTQDGLDIVLIPKTYSTSPGINIHAVTLPAGMSHFSYAPSILGYYHLSRFLDTGHVEPTVVRTMDVAAHKPLADLGKAKAMGSNNRNQWTELRALDETHNNSRLYTNDGKQLYGALQTNPTGEESYPHLSQLSGAGAFAGSSEFGKVTSPNPLKLNCKDATGRLDQVALQQIVQIKDLSDMVLMDFIMSQADRFSGNMHSQKIYVWIESGVLKHKIKKGDPVNTGQEIPPEAVLINRMIMKDNDAGLISGNSAKSYHLLDKVSHMDPKTFNRLLDFQDELQKPEVAQWYETELLFTQADFNTVKNNVDQAVSILNGRKDKGLFLDASLSVALGIEEDSN